MLGVAVGFGAHTGKLKKTKGGGTLTVKNTWYIDVLPRVGYLVTPATEIYVTEGGRFGQYKVSLTGLTSAKKIRIAGLVGAGASARYTFPRGFFLGGEYLYQVSKKLKMPKEVDSDGFAKLRSHTIRLALGMSF